MKIKIYQIDAFTHKVFSGNPAAVCVLESWIDDALMQNIAAENNLAETAFVVKKNDIFEIRWFTPQVEVDLCGHATLASAHVLFNFYNITEDTIHFHSPRSGKLLVDRLQNGEFSMDFPADELAEVDPSELLLKAFNKIPLKTFKGKTDYLLIFQDQEDIETMKPDLSIISKIDARGIIISSKGRDVDFVSRFFGPLVGVDEDPVTGSTHTSLIPYWSETLKKDTLTARQLSKRSGRLNCRLLGDRVKIAGKAVPYLIGEIDV